MYGENLKAKTYTKYSYVLSMSLQLSNVCILICQRFSRQSMENV